MGKAKYSIGQFVRIIHKDMQRAYPDSTGLIVAYALGPDTWYVVLLDDGDVAEFREEWLEPMTSLSELAISTRRASRILDAELTNIWKNVRSFQVPPKI